MITNKEFITWLKGRVPETAFYNSSINRDLDQCVGVYARRNGLIQPQAVGQASTYGVKSLMLLVHWTKNADTCEQKALALWDTLRTAGTAEQIGNGVCWIEARNAPVSVGRDEQGIFETVLDFEVHIRKG